MLNLSATRFASPSFSSPKLIGQRSRFRIPPFRLHRPEVVTEALSSYAASTGQAAYMAGGIDLVDRMKSGRPVADVIHLGRLPELRPIRVEGNDLVIGATATHDHLARSEIVRRLLPSLSRAWAAVANIRVRLKGTLGGNLMAGDPSYDFALIALALRAELGFATPEGDVRWTALGSCPAPFGLLVAIRVPSPAAQNLEIERAWKPRLAFALSLKSGCDGIARIRIAACTGFGRLCCHDLALKSPLAPATILERRETLAAALVAGLPDPLDDWLASAAYRVRLLRILVARRIADAAAEKAFA